MSWRNVSRWSKKIVKKPHYRFCSLFHWLVAEIWGLQKWFPLPWERKWWERGFDEFLREHICLMYMISSGTNLQLDNCSTKPWDFLSWLKQQLSCACSPARAPWQLPTPSLTQREHPFFSFMHFFRQCGLVRWQWVLAPAYTAVFTTQGSWMLTPPLCLMRPVITFNSNRSLTPLPQQYKAKIGQVCYACYGMQWRYFLQVLKCLYYNSCS